MPGIKRNFEVIMRIALLAIFMIYSLVPVSAQARVAGSTTNPVRLDSANVETETRNSLPQQAAVYYQPPNTEQSQVVSPNGDEPPSRIPKKNEVEFYTVAQPVSLNSDELKLTVTIRNHSDAPLKNLTFRDSLETGFEYSINASSPVSYSAAAKEITLKISQINTGEEYTFDYFIKITASKRNEVKGKLWVRKVTLTGDHLQLSTRVSVGLDVSAANAQGSVTVSAQGDSWNDLGRVQIYTDAKTLGGDGLLVFKPLQPSKGPKLQFEIDALTSSTVATDANGEATEQSVSPRQEVHGNFVVPAFMEINLDGYVDLTKVPAGQEPYVATYDETLGIWVKVPILETDVTNNTVTVEAAHFSTWGAGLGSSLPQNGANVLLFDQPYTSLFSGASRYSIPVWAPQGRAGMAPDVSLSYSSATVDGVLGDVQAPWTGVGWNIDGIET